MPQKKTVPDPRQPLDKMDKRTKLYKKLMAEKKASTPAKPPTTSTSPQKPRSQKTATPEPVLKDPQKPNPLPGGEAPLDLNPHLGPPSTTKKLPIVNATLVTQESPAYKTPPRIAKAVPGHIQPHPKPLPGPPQPSPSDDPAAAATPEASSRSRKSPKNHREPPFVRPEWMIELRPTLIFQGIQAAMIALGLKRFRRWQVVDDLLIKAVGTALEKNAPRYVEGVKFWTEKAGFEYDRQSSVRKARLAARLAAIDAISIITSEAALQNARKAEIIARNLKAVQDAAEPTDA